MHPREVSVRVGVRLKGGPVGDKLHEFVWTGTVESKRRVIVPSILLKT